MIRDPAASPVRFWIGVGMLLDLWLWEHPCVFYERQPGSLEQLSRILPHDEHPAGRIGCISREAWRASPARKHTRSRLEVPA